MAIVAPTLFDVPRDRGRTLRLLDGSCHGTVIAPLLKWPGGKGGELARILPALPPSFDRYFEPFVGGGATFFAIPADVPAFINDASVDLMDFYACVQKQDGTLFELLAQMDEWWKALAHFTEASGGGLVDLFLKLRAGNDGVCERGRQLVEAERKQLLRTVPDHWMTLAERFADTASSIVPKKIERMRDIEVRRGQQLPTADIWSNIEGAFKAACYTTLRARYNDGRLAGDRSPRQSALFYFLREYAYAAMFRFNGRGEFNVPYGGITYNRKDFSGKVEHLQSDAVVTRLETATLGCEDFEAFLEVNEPTPDDLVFLDPPYDSDFSDYDLNGFAEDDHRRLASLMSCLPCAFQLVIKSTPAVLEIYKNDDWNFLAFDKKYMWTIKERNDRDATHLMITNY